MSLPQIARNDVGSIAFGNTHSIDREVIRPVRIIVDGMMPRGERTRYHSKLA